MNLIFGLALDDSYFPQLPFTSGGTYYAGPNGLLQILESHYGCTVSQNNVDYIRIEQYRQALIEYLQDNDATFFQKSFTADQFATATEMLSRRDELIEAGWDFQDHKNIPERLQCLSRLEKHITKKGLLTGYADRIKRIYQYIGKRTTRIIKIQLCEPLALLPTGISRILKKLESNGIELVPFSGYPEVPSKPDLKTFQHRLTAKEKEIGTQKAQKDGSLLLLRGQTEAEMAIFLAKLAQQNPSFRPLMLLPNKTRIVDNAFFQEGFPAMGILTASLARPALQLLKLVTTFIWFPLDPFKILEFLSLPIKPLDEGLSFQLAISMSQIPGVKSDAWYATINRYFDEVKEKAVNDKTINPQDIINQYNFWFERKRYNTRSKAPKDEIIAIFRYIHSWSRELFDEKSNNKQSLIILSEQAKRLTELLAALPETQLSPLELERLVRTVYEPAPIQLRPAEKGHWSFIHHPAAIFDTCSHLIWWDFTQSEPVHFFSRWYQHERTYLEASGIYLTYPDKENQVLVWQRKNPIFYTRDQLILCIPEKKMGKEATPHPLMGDLQATFENLEDITIHLSTPESAQHLLDFLEAPEKIQIKQHKPEQPKPIIKLKQNKQLTLRPTETFSSINDLFFYPHKWVFKHQLKLNPSSILSIVEDQTLMGNLSHRLIEQLLKKDPFNWSREKVYSWVSEAGKQLLSKEGSVLLLYGKEPTRINFIKKLQYASWSLINLIANNGWEIYGVEKAIESPFQEVPIKGRMDLILKRGEELAIIDLKWRGLSYRTQMIRNEEDLQLVLYAYLLQEDRKWAHTAYFIIERGTMLARNNEAFKEINGISPKLDAIEVNQRIIDKMRATLKWRRNQLQNGLIELRSHQTAAALEERYSEELMELLEMKSEDARFDDYRALLDLLF